MTDRELFEKAQERVKQLPESERLKFFRSILAVSEAGRHCGEKPEVWAQYAATVFIEVEDNLKEKNT